MAVGGQRDIAGGRLAGEHPLDLGGGIDGRDVAGGVLAADREQPLRAEAEDGEREAGDLEAVAPGQPVDRGERAGVERAGHQHDLRRVAGDGGLQRVVDGGQRGGVHPRDRGGGAEGVGELGVGDVGGDADDDGAAGLLVEGQQVEAGHLALADEAEARLAELAREGLPGGADEREHLLAVGVHFGDKTARGRCHQRLGRLVDAQHGSFL